MKAAPLRELLVQDAGLQVNIITFKVFETSLQSKFKKKAKKSILKKKGIKIKTLKNK